MPLYLNEADVTGLVDMPSAIEVIQDGFAAKARGEAVNRPRLRLPLVDGNYNVMAATWADRGVVGQKSFTAGSAGVALDIVLYDAAGGGLLAIIEGKRLTALRTGAASGVAARWMHPEPGPIALIGTGIQAATQLEAVALATGSSSARVFSRRAEPCAAFAASMTDRLEMEVEAATSIEACVEGAAIVIAVTNTAVPVVTGEMLSPGVLVVAVGCNSWLRCEVDVAAIERCDRIVVDDLEQARTECGDLMRAVEVGRLSWTSVAELADVVVGKEAGRTSTDGIGLFESQGIAIEDVALAEHVYRRALEAGVGARLPEMDPSPTTIDRTIPFVDTHHHLWERDRLPYAWLTGDGDPDETAVLGDYAMIRTDWGPDRLAREFHGQDVVGTVHVEAAMSGDDPVAETVWLDDVHRTHGWPNALVVSCDLRRPDVDRVLDAHLAASSLVRGIRMRGTGDITDPALHAGLDALERRGLSYDLDDVALGPELARRHPALQIVVGHAGAPYDRAPGSFETWSSAIGRLAACETAAIKVSGLGMADHHWTIGSIRPWVLRCIEAFGMDRTMFGTNWPVDLLYAPYTEQVDAYRVILAEAGLSVADQHALLHGNAQRIYGLA